MASGAGYGSDLEIALRYSVPGTLFSLSLAYLVFVIRPQFFPYITIGLALVVVPLGYIVYQFWLFFFTLTGYNENGYCRESRYNLVLIRDRLKQLLEKGNSEISIESRYFLTRPAGLEIRSDEISVIKKDLQKYQKADKLKKLLLLLAYYAWEAWVYENSPKDHLARSRRLWLFYHSNASSALACVIGVITALSTWFFGHHILILSLISGYTLIGVFMAYRARELYSEVNAWETMMLVSDARNLDKLISRVIAFYHTELVAFIKNRL